MLSVTFGHRMTGNRVRLLVPGRYRKLLAQYGLYLTNTGWVGGNGSDAALWLQLPGVVVERA